MKKTRMNIGVLTLDCSGWGVIWWFGTWFLNKVTVNRWLTTLVVVNYSFKSLANLRVWAWGSLLLSRASWRSAIQHTDYGWEASPSPYFQATSSLKRLPPKPACPKPVGFFFSSTLVVAYPRLGGESSSFHSYILRIQLLDIADLIHSPDSMNRRLLS